MNIKKALLLLITFLLILSFSFSQKDTSPPKITILSPKDGAKVSGVITISLQVVDNVGVAKVELYIDNKKIGELTKSPFNFTWDTTKFTSETHTILVKAYDKAGNTSIARITVQVDNPKQISKLSIVSPKDKDRVSGVIKIKVNLLDKNNFEKMEFYIDKDKIGETNGEPFELTFDTNNILNGAHMLTVKGIYKGNISSTDTINIYVVNLKNIYGGKGWDEGVAVAQTSDKNFIVSGWTDSFGKGGADIYLLKLGEWEKTFGGAGDDIAVSMTKTKDGNFVITGLTSSFGVSYYHVYVLKVDKDGNKIWEKAYGGNGYDRGNSVKETKDGGYIIAGITESFGSGFEDVYLLKLNPNGELLWNKAYGTPGFERAYDVIETSDGGYVVVGESQEKDKYTSNAFVLKVKPNGEMEWSKDYGGKGNDALYSVIETKDGGYLGVGYTESFVKKGEIYLIKVDKKGKLLWEKTYGGEGKDEAYSIISSNDGKGYMMVGMMEKEKGQFDGFLAKVDETGKLLWMKNYGGDKSDRINAICQTENGYILVGATESFNAKGCDVYIVKVDEDGNQ